RANGVRPDATETRSATSRDLWERVSHKNIVLSAYVEDVLAREMALTFAKLMHDYEPLSPP
ncbi:MAG TPA: hypothetical protein VFN67_33815, partial [Polyangiales bacterium]|nr:hypothetical protein [Polyangiales bacterium]